MLAENIEPSCLCTTLHLPVISVFLQWELQELSLGPKASAPTAGNCVAGSNLIGLLRHRKWITLKKRD